jgi:hypothetical protein
LVYQVAIAAAYNGLAFAEDVVGKSGAGFEVVVLPVL